MDEKIPVFLMNSDDIIGFAKKLDNGKYELTFGDEYTDKINSFDLRSFTIFAGGLVRG